MPSTQLRLDLPELESDLLSGIQEQLKKELGMTNVSKNAAIRWLIRNAKLSISEQTIEQ